MFVFTIRYSNYCNYFKNQPAKNTVGMANLNKIKHIHSWVSVAIVDFVMYI